MTVWNTFLLTVIVTTVLVTACSFASGLNNNIKRFAQEIQVIDQAILEANDLAIEKSLKFAPQGRSIYLLRGDAQRAAQTVLDELIKLYNLSPYTLPTIRFRPTLGDDSAGTASNCADSLATGIHLISLNEILFLRNYDDYMAWVIPHEVAHVVTCMLGGVEQSPDETFQQAAHGEEWLQVMRDLEFPIQSLTSFIPLMSDLFTNIIETSQRG